MQHGGTKMRKISKLIALTMLLSFSWSQTAGKVRGTVSSADGQPLVGANVVIDGTAKGGILLAIGRKFKLPIIALGMGEKEDDLQTFNSEYFARALMHF